jgi:chromate reductase, NAD(P)H dehydrogenase (quinone)
MTASPIHVLGFAGSLRAGSTNRALLEAARQLAPDDIRLTIVELDDVPLYNGDLDEDGRRPEAVERLKAAIAEADALLIATPEYNYGIPGVLKNAIDWASRPARRSPLAGKPVGMMGATKGPFGAVRALEHLKAAMLSAVAHPLPFPVVAVPEAAAKFEDGRLTDERTLGHLVRLLEELAAWTRRLKSSDAQST